VNGLVFDSLGNPHNLAVTYTKVASNEWAAQVEPPAEAAVIIHRTQNNEVHQSSGRIDFADTANGDITGSITFDAMAQPITIELDPVGPDTPGPYGPGGPFVVQTSGRTIGQILDQVATVMNGYLSDSNVFGTPLSPPGTWARRVAGENGITFDQADNTLPINFSASALDSVGKQMIFQNATGGYQVPALDATYGQYLMTLGPPNTVTRQVSTLEFNGAGTPLNLYGRDSAQAPDPKSTIDVVWANGAAPTGTQESPSIQFNQGNYNTPDGITQLSGDFQLNFLQQNGAKFGNFSGVSIGTDGVVTALFDNGVTRPVFQIPLATFTNPNGLQSLSGNVWIATDFSGNPTLRQAGEAGSGQVNAAALEASTVDLGTEFTRMITTQRAYSSSAKVITTADQMLDELLQIKR
jgi:flagellar hook protein FlgE